MIIIFLLLGIALIFWAWRNFPLAFSILFICNTMLAHFYLLGSATVYGFCAVLFTVLFAMKYKHSFRGIRMMPCYSAMMLLMISWCITNFLAGGQNRHTPTLIVNIFCTLGISATLWSLIKRGGIKMMRHLTLVAVVYALILGVYGLYETITASNPWAEYFANKDYSCIVAVVDGIRFGIKRAQSLFAMHTTFGGVMLNIFAIMLIASKTIYQGKKYILWIAVLCLVCIFLTGARSCILGAMVVGMMYFQKLKVKHVFCLIIFLGVAWVGTGDYFQQFSDSILNTNSVEGSNSDMRRLQLMITLKYFLQSPIWGNGIGYLYTEIVAKEINSDLCGAESMWFGVLGDYGAIGVVAYSVLYIAPIVYSFKRGNKIIAFYVIGVLLLFTLSSVPQVPETLIIAYTILLNKMMDYAKQCPKVIRREVSNPINNQSNYVKKEERI